jgi:hypothetical protein
MGILQSGIAVCVASLFFATAGPCAVNESLEALRLAAEQGNAGAQTRVGVIYELVIGVSQDYAVRAADALSPPVPPATIGRTVFASVCKSSNGVLC